jgi:predicted branched-subunit amino acid permease
MSERRTAFWHGVRDLLPLVSGVLPFGLITGATGVSLGGMLCLWLLRWLINV